MRVSWPVAFCETEPMNHSKRCQTAAKPLRRSNAFCSMCGRGKIMNIDEKSLQFRSSMHLWFLFLSQELGENRQRTSLFSYRTSVLHIFVRPNESKSGTSFKVFVIEPAVVNYPGLDIVILQLNRAGQDDGCVCCRSWKILAYQSAFLVSGVKPSATRNHWGQLGRWRIWKVAFKVPIAKISTHTEALYDASACTKLQSVQVLYLIC